MLAIMGKRIEMRSLEVGCLLWRKRRRNTFPGKLAEIAKMEGRRREREGKSTGGGGGEMAKVAFSSRNGVTDIRLRVKVA